MSGSNCYSKWSLIVSSLHFPSGENAFFYMQIPLGWARRPLLERVGTDLDSRIPITFIYGTRSWMDNKSGSIIKARRPDSYVDIHFIHGAGHHVHAEQPEAFNAYVKKIFAVVETGQDLLEPTPSLNASLWVCSTHNSMSKWFVVCVFIVFMNSVIVTQSLSDKFDFYYQQYISSTNILYYSIFINVYTCVQNWCSIRSIHKDAHMHRRYSWFTCGRDLVWQSTDSPYLKQWGRHFN